MILQGVFQKNKLLGGDKSIIFLFLPLITWVSWSNLTVAYLFKWDGLVQPPNQLHDSHHLSRESLLRRCLGVQAPTLWHPDLLYPNFFLPQVEAVLTKAVADSAWILSSYEGSTPRKASQTI